MRRVAIACQGGGSHTAFTGGALQRLLADGNQTVVALSGTSGGAVCALLAWYGLLTGGAAEAGRLLERFWAALEKSYGVQGESFAYLLKECWQRAGATQHTARQSEQRGRFGSGLGCFSSSTRGGVHDGTQRDRYDEKRKQRKEVFSLGNGEHPHRWGEVEVQKQESADGREQRRE